MNDEYDVVVDEKSTKVLNVIFKNSGKSVKITLTPGTDKADVTGLRKDCPNVVLESDDDNIYLDTPNMGDLL